MAATASATPPTSAQNTSGSDGPDRDPAPPADDGPARSTVGLILRRLGLGRLSALDPKIPAVRYERAAPGEMMHLDIMKRGKFKVEGHRVTGDRQAGRSRKAYTEILPSEGPQNTTALLERAPAWLTRRGVAVQRVMTENGSAYRSKLFAKALQVAPAPATCEPAPTCPAPTIQTSLREWAYGRPYACSDNRAKAIKPWTDNYNLARPHSGIKGLTPWQRVNNLLGNDN